MNRKRISRILAKADAAKVAELAHEIEQKYAIIIIKEPRKTLTMIRMREPVKSSLFHLGEVIVTEAIVSVEDIKGMAVLLGDQPEKTLHMAILDAAYNKGIFVAEHVLLELERAQMLHEQKENALHLKTMVSFQSMDQQST